MIVSIRNLQLSPLSRANMRGVLRVEKLSYDRPWTPMDLLQVLECGPVWATVAATPKRVCGFLLAKIEGDRTTLLNIAVHPRYRRRGVASAMLKLLLNSSAPRPIGCMVDEDNLPMHLLLRSHGFKANAVARDEYGERNMYAFVHVDAGKEPPQHDVPRKG